MQKSPLSIVTERFGDDRVAAKAKLVKAVKDLAGSDLWVERLNNDKGLERVSNAKLLHLEAVLGEVKKDVGSRDKLIAELLKLSKREGDADYKSALAAKSTPALWDALKARRATPDKKPRSKRK